MLRLLCRSMRFQGKRVIVTGAASGLGAAIAHACMAEGAEVIAIDRIEAPFPDSRICDVGDENAVREALADLQRVDALVNSAGISRRAPVDEAEMTDFDAVMHVNLRGSFLISKHVLPLMIGAGGAILHLASVVGVTGTRNRAAYSASKGAIVALTRNMALDYARHGVRVNCLCPGFVRTPLLTGILNDVERVERLTALHPLGRLGEPEDIANAALFLLSDQAAWITGQAIAVDGGFTAGHAVDI